MFHCQFDEGNLSPCFALGFTVHIKIFLVIIVGSIAIPTESKMIRNDCPFPVIERLEG